MKAFVVDVRVRPGARTTGFRASAWPLRVDVAAEPTDGRANDVLCRFLAREVFGVPIADVTVVSGASARTKRIAISGDPEQLAARLDDALQASSRPRSG